ncbi:ankyrin, partial [Amniculicola lignicola CBS 123094]
MARDVKGSIPLHYAAVVGRDDPIVTLLVYHGPAKNGFDIEAENLNGYTALQLAALNRHIAAQVLVSFGADVNAMDSYGQTPLHVAVLNGKEEAVKLLIGSGANVEAMNRDSQNALQLA